MAKSKFDPFDAPAPEAAPASNGDLLPEPFDFQLPAGIGGPGRQPSAVQAHYDSVLSTMSIGDQKALPVNDEFELRRFRTVIQTAAKKHGMTARCVAVEHEGRQLLGFTLVEKQTRAPMSDEQRAERAAKSRATREANKAAKGENINLDRAELVYN